MLPLIVTLLLTPILSSDDWVARETAQHALTVLGDRAAVHTGWKRETDPEAKMRLAAVRTVFTIREVDRLAVALPEADRDLNWPCMESQERAVMVLFGWLPPEFFRAPYTWQRQTCCGDPFYYMMPPGRVIQQERTRSALIRYALRTDDWDTIRKVLK